MKNWQKLLDKLRVIGTPLTNNKMELVAFEEQANVKLPIDYHVYCQVFGGGDFNEIIGIERVAKDSQEMVDKLDEQKDFKDSILLGNEDNEILLRLVRASYIFGLRTLGTGVFFAFDTSSYRDDDQSCDIYLIKDDIGRVHSLGRNFHEFIANYCIGEKLLEDFPNIYFADPDFVYPMTFSCWS